VDLLDQGVMLAPGILPGEANEEFMERRSPDMEEE
jgi:hypothetical protein